MELCSTSLEDYIEDFVSDFEFVSYDDIKHILTAVVTGLDFLHQQKLIHRDIKPQNILLKKPNEYCTQIQEMIPKLTDFGISKLTSSKNAVTTNTAAMGSRGYMAPEVLMEQDDETMNFLTIESIHHKFTTFVFW